MSAFNPASTLRLVRRVLAPCGTWALGAILAACATELPPVPDAPEPLAGAATQSLSVREAQARRAAQGLGWVVVEAQPGRLLLARPGGDPKAAAVRVELTGGTFRLVPLGDPGPLEELRRSIRAQAGL